MSATFDRALEALRSEGELSPSDVPGFSDMDVASAETLRRLWPDATLDRRRALLRLAGTLADEHIELNFDRLALIGLEDDDAAVRRQAVANLWESEDAGLVRRFIDVLRLDPDPGVREEAARALGRFVLGLEEQESVAGDRRNLEEALLAAAGSDQAGLRLRAVESLGYSSRPEIPSLIQSTYEAADDESRRAALLAMGRSGDGRWREAVLADLRHRAPAVRREAAHAAGELDLRGSVSELTELLEDTDTGVVLQAIWALGQIGGKTAERALLRAQRSAADEATRLAISESLEHLTFLEGTRDLEAALRARSNSE